MAKETKLQIVIDAQNRTQGAFATLGSNLDAISKKTADVRAGMTAVGSAGAVAFGGLSLLTAGAIKTAAGMESLMMGLSAVSGSSEEANKQLRELREVAKLPGLGLKEAIQGSTNLQAAGLSANTAERALKSFGNALATVGRGKAELSGVVLALTQIAAKGKVSAEEINQLNERIPQIRVAMKAAFGTSDTEALAKMGIDSETFINGIIEQFEKLPPVAAGTSIAFENVQDTLFLLSNSVGTSLLPAVNQILVTVGPVIEKMAAWAAEHPKLTAAILLITLAVTGLLALLLPIALALPGLILLWGGLTAVLVGAAAVAAPLILGIIGIMAVLAAMKVMGLDTKAAWQDVWLGIKLIAADAANAVIGTVEAMVNFILEGVNRAIRAINSVIAAAQKVPGIGKNIKSIGEVKADFGTFDSGTIAANDLAGRSNPVNWGNQVVNLIGGNYLSRSVAEEIGDLIMGKLKMSNQL